MRRVHGVGFTAQVLAESQQPRASVAAIALAHGLNVNLLRKRHESQKWWTSASSLLAFKQSSGPSAA
jgi:transposase-like protein